MRHELPDVFIYLRPYQIEEIYEHWRESGRWWIGESELDVYRVIAENTFFELHSTTNKERWRLYRIYD